MVLLSKDENYRSYNYLENHITNIINQIHYIEYTKYYCKLGGISNLYNKLKGKYCIDKTTSKEVMDYLSECNLLHVARNIIKNSSVMEIILISIINKHYKEILDNVEGYINYCKTEKLKVDFDKINKFINFIKEYVKSIYGFDLI